MEKEILEVQVELSGLQEMSKVRSDTLDGLKRKSESFRYREKGYKWTSELVYVTGSAKVLSSA